MEKLLTRAYRFAQKRSVEVQTDFDGIYIGVMNAGIESSCHEIESIFTNCSSRPKTGQSRLHRAKSKWEEGFNPKKNQQSME